MLAVSASPARTTHREEELLGQQPSPCLRSLTSILSDHGREYLPDANKTRVSLKEEEKEKEVELESSSLFVKLEHSDISPLFSAEESSDLTRAATQQQPSPPRPPPPPNVRQLPPNVRQLPVQRTREDGLGVKPRVPIPSTGSNQEVKGSGRDLLLADLSPRGFRRTIAPPFAEETAVVVAEDLLRENSITNTLTVEDKESELERTQAWTRLVPSSDPPAVVPVNACQQDRQNGHTPQQQQQQQHHNAVSSKELPRPSAADIDLSSVVPHPLFGKLHLNCDAYENSGEHTEVEPAVVVVPMAAAAEKRSIEYDNNDDVVISNGPNEGERERVPSTATTTTTVVVREREEELKRALDRLVPRLLQSEEKVKNLEHRLQEAMRGESGRNALIKQVAKLESEVKHVRERLELRHCEALEWRDVKQALEIDNGRLNAELHRALDRGVRLECENRRRDALLVETRANADGLSEKNARLETELRHKGQLLDEAEKERKRVWQTANASAETMKAAARQAEAAATEADNLRIEVRRREHEHANSTVEGQRQSPLARLGGAADGGWVDKQLSWEPELDRPTSSPVEREQSRGHSLSPNRDRQVGRTKCSPVEDTATLGRQKLDFRDDFVKCSPTTSPPAGNSLARRSAIDTRNGNKLRRAGRGLSSDSEGTRDQLTPPRQESVWMHDVDHTPPVAARTKGREQCDVGDRQRYDSEGVKGALTAARPEWADNAPAGSSLKAKSEVDVSGNISKVESSGCQTQVECAGIDRGHGEDAQWRDIQCGSRDKDESPLAELAALGWTPSRQSFPAAGHRRGRNAMSSRRSSLSGAGVGVHNESDNGEARKAQIVAETIETASEEGGIDREMLASAHGTADVDHRNTLGSSSWRSPMRPTSSLADMIGESQLDAQPDRIRHKRGPVPFATEAAEDELRPVREVENKLMLLQMEASQLEAEQRKLLPKASKTMHARVRMRDIESRLEWLTKESSGLRRILRKKPWRM